MDTFYVAHLYAFGNVLDILKGDHSRAETARTSEEIADISGSHPGFYNRKLYIGSYRSSFSSRGINREGGESVSTNFHVFPGVIPHPELTLIGYNSMAEGSGEEIENLLSDSVGRGGPPNTSRIRVIPYREIEQRKGEVSGSLRELEFAKRENNPGGICKTLEELWDVAGWSKQDQELYGFYIGGGSEVSRD